jgi:hypothetical protein
MAGLSTRPSSLSSRQRNTPIPGTTLDNRGHDDAIFFAALSSFALPVRPWARASLTGYLGGAIASHMRIGSPLFSRTLFGLYLGLMVWGGLWLRDKNLQSLVPFRL